MFHQCADINQENNVIAYANIVAIYGISLSSHAKPTPLWATIINHVAKLQIFLYPASPFAPFYYNIAHKNGCPSPPRVGTPPHCHQKRRSKGKNFPSCVVVCAQTE